MVTWKEPLSLKQRLKMCPNLQARHLLKIVVVMLLGGIFFTAALYFFRPPNGSDWWLPYDRFFWFFMSLHLLFLFVYVCGSFLSICFEATFHVDSKGITIRRAGFARLLPWRYVTNLQIIPHPTVEDIALLKVVSQSMNKQRIAELPYKLGQINVSDAIELHKKYGKK